MTSFFFARSLGVRSWCLDSVCPKNRRTMFLNGLAEQFELVHKSISIRWTISCSMILCNASSRSLHGIPLTIAFSSSRKEAKRGVVAMAISKSICGFLRIFEVCIVVIPPAEVMRVESRNESGRWAMRSQSLATSPSKKYSSLSEVN